MAFIFANNLTNSDKNQYSNAIYFLHREQFWTKKRAAEAALFNVLSFRATYEQMESFAKRKLLQIHRVRASLGRSIDRPLL
jgi:hypothetical protein